MNRNNDAATDESYEKLAEVAPKYARRRYLDGHDYDAGLDSAGRVRCVDGPQQYDVIDEHIEDVFDVAALPEYVEGCEDVIVDAALRQLDADDEDMREGDTLYAPEFDNFTEHFSADADGFGNIRNALYETPDGQFVHVSYRPGESVKHDEYGIVTAYGVKQVGDRIETTLKGVEGRDGGCVEFLIGDWPCYDARWSGTTVSVSTLLDGWDDLDIDALQAAGEFDITFEVTLVSADDDSEEDSDDDRVLMTDGGVKTDASDAFDVDTVFLRQTRDGVVADVNAIRYTSTGPDLILFGEDTNRGQGVVLDLVEREWVECDEDDRRWNRHRRDGTPVREAFEDVESTTIDAGTLDSEDDLRAEVDAFLDAHGDVVMTDGGCSIREYVRENYPDDCAGWTFQHQNGENALFVVYETDAPEAEMYLVEEPNGDDRAFRVQYWEHAWGKFASADTLGWFSTEDEAWEFMEKKLAEYPVVR